jgi:biopolymer transport protein ExbD
MNQPPPPGDAPPQPFVPRPPQKQAGMVAYKRELRKAINKNRVEPEINFLNITAMMDMMTIILVFLLMSLSNSVASLPQSDDLKLPKSILTAEMDGQPEGISLIVSRTQIIAADAVICPVPPDAAQYGLEAKYKRGSRNDFFIVPLGSALQAWRDTDKRLRAASGKDPSQSDAILIVDNRTPYRVLTEVMYTLGQTEFAKFHMLVLQGDKGGK